MILTEFPPHSVSLAPETMDDVPKPDTQYQSGSSDVASADRRWRIVTILRRLYGGRSNGSARIEIEQALKADEAAGEAFSPEERSMLRAILKLGDMRVDDVMIPRADIDAVDEEIAVGDLLGAFRKAGHSRMPVYRDTLDDPVGMAHIKDIMAWIADTADTSKTANGQNTAPFDLTLVDLQTTLKAAQIMRPLLFVPPSMSARMLLERMQASRTQMALIIDEYGGTDGLVSLEDLVEIIVGEIVDEHDNEDEFTLTMVQDGQYIVDARVPIEDVREQIGPTFQSADSEADVDTVGGLIFTEIGRIPVPGELLPIPEGYEMEILDADPRRIKRVKITERKRKGALRSRARSAASPADPKPS